MMIYLARPIDKNKAPMEGFVSLRDRLIEAGYPGAFYNPVGAFWLPLEPIDSPTSQRLVAINNEAIKHCHAVVMEHLPGIESWGCSQELAVARQANVPVVFLTPLKHSELSIYIKCWMWGHEVTNSIEDAVLRLKGIKPW